LYAPKYRLEAIETIGRKILLEYDRTLLEGPPQAIPVETIIETKFNLTLEYHTLRKNGSVLGETIFDDGAAILYDRTERQYRLIAVKAGTILIDERLCINKHSSGLHCGSTILLEQLRTIDKSRLKGRIGMLSEPEMKRIDWALGISIGLAEGYD
jgi:hypothetical protein